MSYAIYRANPWYEDITSNNDGILSSGTRRDIRFYSWLAPGPDLTQEDLIEDDWMTPVCEVIIGKYTEGEITHTCVINNAHIIYTNNTEYDLSFVRSLLFSIDGAWTPEDRNSNGNLYSQGYWINRVNRVFKLLYEDGLFDSKLVWISSTGNDRFIYNNNWANDEDLVDHIWSYRIVGYSIIENRIYELSSDGIDNPYQITNQSNQYIRRLSDNYIKYYIQYEKSLIGQVTDSYLDDTSSAYNNLYRILTRSIARLKSPDTKTYTNSTWGSSKKWYIKTTFSPNSSRNVVNYVTMIRNNQYKNVA